MNVYWNVELQNNINNDEVRTVLQKWIISEMMNKNLMYATLTTT